ncbi:MAG TPA: hypothetical protein VKT78_08860 [Fimbriimonadaceae bacterium]|nr:hypothetical protein [Fimbriimonadaceae bacterium]
MRLEVARAATICWFGNEHLFSADESHLAEVTLKPVFRGVERLEFIRPNAHQFAAPGAAFVLGTKMWYRRIKAEGIESLRLHLPISLVEPATAAYGVVSDSPDTSDIWVLSPKSTPRELEYAAQRFAAWSMPRPRPVPEVLAELEAAVTALNAAHGGEGAALPRRIARLATAFADPGTSAEGYEECIPNEFSLRWRSLAARALRVVALLGTDDLKLCDFPAAAAQADAVWRLSLRLLESITAEVIGEHSRAVAA